MTDWTDAEIEAMDASTDVYLWRGEVVAFLNTAERIIRARIIPDRAVLAARIHDTIGCANPKKPTCENAADVVLALLGGESDD